MPSNSSFVSLSSFPIIKLHYKKIPPLGRAVVDARRPKSGFIMLYICIFCFKSYHTSWIYKRPQNICKYNTYLCHIYRCSVVFYIVGSAGYLMWDLFTFLDSILWPAAQGAFSIPPFFRLNQTVFSQRLFAHVRNILRALFTDISSV